MSFHSGLIVSGSPRRDATSRRRPAYSAGEKLSEGLIVGQLAVERFGDRRADIGDPEKQRSCGLMCLIYAT